MSNLLSLYGLKFHPLRGPTPSARLAGASLNLRDRGSLADRGDAHPDLPKLRIRVPDAAGAIDPKAFADVTTRELQAAASHEKEGYGTRPKRAPRVSVEVTRKVAARKSRGASLPFRR